jgi:UDP-N-acetylmuramate dehydrogenase
MQNYQNILPPVKGEYRYNFPLAQSTWFGVGGNADVFFKPADEADLAHFLKHKPSNIPHLVLGVCSNIIIRDGGFKGVIIKLGRAFAGIESDQKNNIITAGASALDVNVAQFAANNNITGLEFLVGIPGVIGGALAMNAGAYGAEIKDVLIEATAIDEQGNIDLLTPQDFKFEYRKNNLPRNYIFTSAKLQGRAGDKDQILVAMQQISDTREASQPIRSKTGGSTFKNPPPETSNGLKAWQLIDNAGCRGLKFGGAQVSEKHCNFLINTGNATAADIENLGEEVRSRVLKNSGVELKWEIKIVGEK